MSQVHYVKVEGKHAPINIKPAGIKCFTCDEECPADKLEDHLSSHVDPKYIQPSTNLDHPHKVTMSKMIASDQTEDSDFIVKSLLPEEVPQSDNEKKKAIFLEPTQKKVDNDLTAANVEVRDRGF